MRATNGAKTTANMVSITVGGLRREVVKRLRDDARDHHRSLAGHIRAILKNALAAGGAQ
jgi:plasmid stability protein